MMPARARLWYDDGAHDKWVKADFYLEPEGVLRALPVSFRVRRGGRAHRIEVEAPFGSVLTPPVAPQIFRRGDYLRIADLRIEIAPAL